VVARTGDPVIEVEEEILVALPCERVFRFAAKPENMPLWNPAVRESRTIGRLREGAKVVQQIEVVGRRFEATYEVTTYQPHRRITYTCTKGPIDVQGTMEFHRERGSTRVRWIVGGDCGRFLRLPQTVLLGLGRPQMRACLDNLKRAVEAPERTPLCAPRPAFIDLRPASLLARAASRFS
jgi:uncharacterized protein YndB with AHSA1/START domain